jgi:hypothetical protein
MSPIASGHASTGDPESVLLRVRGCRALGLSGVQHVAWQSAAHQATVVVPGVVSYRGARLSLTAAMKSTVALDAQTISTVASHPIALTSARAARAPSSIPT